MNTQMQWQPINTAPKDGRVVLVNDTNDGCAHWAAASWVSGPEWSGWVYEDPVLSDNIPMGPQPTHWFDLPEVPTT